MDPACDDGRVLELYEQEGAFERLETWLRERGFFAPGGESLVADLYLGYGLAQGLRRTASPPPPEPCRLPFVACRVHDAPHLVGEAVDDGVMLGQWERTWPADAYGEAVERVRDAIACGDVYQVNLVQHLSAPFAGDPGALAARLAWLRPLHGVPLRGDGWAIVSASPELFLARRGRRVWTCPIKGTRPLGEGDELASSTKDAAEHLMIVDLERNDLSRVCEPGSVRWPELMATRELAGVEHMVSTVEGTLRDGVGLAELLVCDVPGRLDHGCTEDRRDRSDRRSRAGRARRLPWGRSGACAATATSSSRSRSAPSPIAGGRLHLWVGGGIVWDSDPEAEVEESLVKARPLLAAIGAPLPRSGLAMRLLALAVSGRGLVDPATAVVAADDEGFSRGRAAFETLRVYGGRPFRLRAAPRAPRALGCPHRAVRARPRRGASGSPRSRSTARRRRTAVLRLYWTPGPPGGEPSALALVSAMPDWIEETRARGQRLVTLTVPRRRRPGSCPARSRSPTRPTSRRSWRRRVAAPTTRSSSTTTASCSRAR